MKKPTRAVSLQIPLFTNETINILNAEGVCLASPEEKEVFTFFRSDPWQGHRRVR